MLDLQPASFEEFEREAGRGNVVPVVRSVLADLQTPVGAFLRVAGASPYSFLLESVEGGERVARYSFLGADPSMIVRGRGRQTVLERGSKRETVDMRATEFLREYFRDRELARRSGLPPLAGGAVGYLSYDAARWFEPVLGTVGDGDASTADMAVWMFYRTLLAFDRVRQQIEIISIVLTEEAEGSRTRLRELYEGALKKTAKIEKLLASAYAPRTRRKSSHSDAADDSSSGGSGDGGEQSSRHAALGSKSKPFESNWTREGFEAAVGRVKDRIAAGDCYQVVLSQRFSRETRAESVAIYRALRSTNPSPYMYFLRMGDETIIGASPEMLVRCRGQRLDYRPIAGTRKRGATETEDWMLGEEMRADEKEVAEHTMLVDLGRNDLGRVAEYGSVKVDDLMSVERYSHVQHLVSSLRARLRDGLDRLDALASCFPAGTVTGAPKVRAMEIIQELEPEPRGVYAGAVLYMDYADNLDSCIAIRTILMRDGRAMIQAGAGIVADSVPEREYEETISKARALVRAIELAERGL
ncbi:MAG TPA: anthranilate synthase component I family protein [Pyrinomonadaceae bacterium]|jgi:anthranilate synthase component 1|nr:anthranilate synthase component I family protein [Pyrinomonadaceae bacterium]